MFKNVLDKTRGDDQDLGLVGITHPQLNNPIVVPIHKWSLLNSNTVMDNIERVINSEENLPLDAQMQITIGSIAIPRGSGTLAITRLTGPQNSIAIKRSLMKISNDNHMYLATAIGRCFMQFCKVVSLLEWKEISKDDDPTRNAMAKAIKQKKTTELL
jgi:hypothetical protein